MGNLSTQRATAEVQNILQSTASGGIVAFPVWQKSEQNKKSVWNNEYIFPSKNELYELA